MPPPSRSYRDYTIGWICAVEPELIAARAMLDETHDKKLPAVDGDNNNYKFGRIGPHNVVIASLPSGNYGTNPAASVAGQMKRTFPSLRFGLLVGIGGGVPRLTADDPADIRLGDVVVSDPTYHTGGVVQYDRGRTNEGEQRPERTGTLNKPPESLLTAVLGLKASQRFKDHPLECHLAQMIRRHSRLAPEYTYQGVDNDILFEAGYKHVGRGSSCAECSKSKCISRPHRRSTSPSIHYGTIASGNQVVKDSVTRDYWRDEEGILCFEMEAAGLMDSFPCLVIRGICDYADSHKNMRWQPYAAATAAAYAKDLLLEIAPAAVVATDSPFEGQLELGNVHWMVPRNANTHFTGREDVLERLDRSLGPQSNSLDIAEHQRRFVIYGYGGIGKSEVCLKFANDHRQHFWGIFWINASSEETARQAFIDAGERCGANAEDFEQMRTWLANERHPWLLIIDNADNPQVDYAALFPSGNKGNIILTTRNPECRTHETVGCEDLDHLDLQDAQSLLFKAAGMSTSLYEDSQKAAEKVIRALGFHTLAIIQAGAYIRLRFCSLEDYPVHFRQQEERLLKYHPKQARSAYGSVFATFEISATHLQSSQDECAADALSLLQILGFIHFQEIPELTFVRAQKEAVAIHEHIKREGPICEIDQLSELQTARLPPFMMLENDTDTEDSWWRWREALSLLESYSFIKIAGSSEDLSFSMHPLIHKWTRIRHDLASRKEGWRTAGSIISLAMRGTNYDMFHEKLRSHVTAYLDYLNSEYLADMTETEICQTHFRICWLFSNLHDYPKLRHLLGVLEKFEAWAGARGYSGLPMQLLAAICLIEEGQPHEAILLLQRYVDTEHVQDPQTQILLARAYYESEQYQKALILLEHVVRIEETSKQRNDVSVLESRYLLALAHLGSAHFEKAVTLFQHVVENAENTWAPVHPHRLAAEQNLGLAYIETHQYEKAAKILRHVLDIRHRVLDVTDPYLLSTQHELARAYLGMGNGHYERAVELLEQVVEIEKRKLAFDDPNLLVSQYNLALAYHGLGSGHYEKAAGLLEQVVTIGKRILEPDDSLLLNSQSVLAEIYIDMGNGRHERAADLLERVVKIEERTLASNDSDLLASQHNLALCYNHLGSRHYEKAAGLLEQVVAIRKRILEPDHSCLLQSQQLLEKVYGRIEAEEDGKSTSASGEEV